MGKRCCPAEGDIDKNRRAVIRVSLAALVTIYLLLFLAAVFLFWIGESGTAGDANAGLWSIDCAACCARSNLKTEATLYFRGAHAAEP